ncbi:hypothetical protein DM791_20360 [Paenarthrobacter nitroguajacolicus]|nr:hypothetical protein [Paenarthrobacter nitroguajacolicus]NWL35226.1 hypothetical protein [Paenarthrobacter nitroguajacolicus]
MIYRRNNNVDRVIHGVSGRNHDSVHHGSGGVRRNHLVDYRNLGNHMINRAPNMFRDGRHRWHVNVDLLGRN